MSDAKVARVSSSVNLNASEGAGGKPKICKKCGGTSFYKDLNCKKCNAAACAAYRSKHPDRIRATAVRHYRKHQKEIYARKHKHGMSPERISELIASQNDKCAACGDALLPGRGTHIDHDHDTGEFRGILCRGCNLAEGFLRGSSLRARKLAAYIDRHAPKLKLVMGERSTS